MLSKLPNVYQPMAEYNRLLYKAFDPIFDNPFMNALLDAQMDFLLKAYYWPAFVAGNMDNWSDMMRPFNICKPYK